MDELYNKKLYKTNLSVSQCKDRLKKNLKKSYMSNWYNDACIGSVRGNKYKYSFHKAFIRNDSGKAYLRNDFHRQLTGKIYHKNGQTFVTAKLINPLLNNSLYIFGLGTSLYIIASLSNNFSNSFISFIETVALLVLLFGMFTLAIGFISISIPLSKEKQEPLFGFIEDLLALEEVDNE